MTTSPLRRLAAGTCLEPSPVRDPVRDRFGPGLAQRVGLRLAAAFGHRFGEVREQHRKPEPERDLAGEQRPCRRRSASSWTNTIVVSRLPTSTMNITGFLIWIRGSSLRKRIDDRLPDNHRIPNRNPACAF